MYQKKILKNIVVASNPFGYGPTGNIIELLKELDKKYRDDKNIQIYFIGSKMCLDVVPSFSSIIKYEIDERDIIQITKFLKSLKGEIITIGSQNRFIPKATKEIGGHSIFIDILSWMWHKIPEDHLIADKIYWMNIPGIEEKLKMHKNIEVIPLMFERFSRDSKQDSTCVILAGGLTNPIRDVLQLNYIKLLVASAERLSNSYSKVIITTSKKASEEFNKHIKKTNVFANTYSRHEYRDIISKAQKIYAVGGMSSTIELLVSKISFDFIIPSNLASFNFQKLLLSGEEKGLYWEKYMPELNPVMSELESMDYIDKICEKILDNKNLLNEILIDTERTTLEKPDSLYIKNFDLKNTGAEEIIKYLTKLIKA